jgi:hypothetical protein
VAVTPDGATVLCGWDTGEVTNPRSLLVAIDVGSGERRVLLDDPGSSVGRIACSPDGRLAVCERIRHGDPGHPMDVGLWLVDLAGGEGLDLTAGLDLWPSEPVWAADGRALFFVADEHGRTPVFRVEVGGEAEGGSPGSAPTAPSPTSARPSTAAGCTPCGPPWGPRPGRSPSTRPPPISGRRRCPPPACPWPCPAP